MEFFWEWGRGPIGATTTGGAAIASADLAEGTTTRTPGTIRAIHRRADIHRITGHQIMGGNLRITAATRRTMAVNLPIMAVGNHRIMVASHLTTVAVDTTVAVNRRAAEAVVASRLTMVGVVVNRPAAEAEANHLAVEVVVAVVATRASGELFAVVEESRGGGAHRSAAFHLHSAADSRVRELSSANVKAACPISDADAGMPRKSDE